MIIREMSIPLGFTERHLRIWGLRRDGLPQAEIARRLNVTRQAINKALRRINNNVSQTLEATALAAKIEVHHIDPKRGILLGFSHETKDQAIITFSTQHGTHIWHTYTGQCEGCELHKSCREVIVDEAGERGITLTEEEKKKNPAEIARFVFSKIIPGLEP
jgi:DNA-binding CsgD family transcriptional regulator